QISIYPHSTGPPWRSSAPCRNTACSSPTPLADSSGPSRDARCALVDLRYEPTEVSARERLRSGAARNRAQRTVVVLNGRDDVPIVLRRRTPPFHGWNP